MKYVSLINKYLLLIIVLLLLNSCGIIWHFRPLVGASVRIEANNCQLRYVLVNDKGTFYPQTIRRDRLRIFHIRPNKPQKVEIAVQHIKGHTREVVGNQVRVQGVKTSFVLILEADSSQSSSEITVSYSEDDGFSVGLKSNGFKYTIKSVDN